MIYKVLAYSGIYLLIFFLSGSRKDLCVAFNETWNMNGKFASAKYGVSESD